MAKQIKETQNYIDEDKFSSAVIEYNNKVITWDKLSDDDKLLTEKPKISNYIGECFTKLALNYGRISSFSQYSWLDDARANGVELCLRYIKNYNPDVVLNLEHFIAKFGEVKGVEKFRIREERVKGKKNKEKTAGAFAYFTQTIHNAFLVKLLEEEKERVNKWKSMIELCAEMEFVSDFEDNDGTIIKFDSYQNINEYVNDYEKGILRKWNDKEKKKLEKYLEPKGLEVTSW